MMLSYWKDLALRIARCLREYGRSVFIGVSIVAAILLQFIACMIILVPLFEPFCPNGANYLFAGIIGALLFVVELFLWIDYYDWKQKPEKTK
jgi:uncharacterized membrane protein